eukprot:CAMPEP_0198140742 /NCGR_PEP_ID=MMETSP1443-20131203/3861_1 /TAXON_ID=186043 /ORGANISM="Entomoneis sp., Strain CCMP2396" /LENGTH=451 /DNA_ID=CAMNT_0043803265 /DNA_START=139 /DNA_END=1494 /DNA_ORIENTATION=+
MSSMSNTTSDDLTAEQALHLADSLYVDESYTEAMDAYTAAEAVWNDSSSLPATLSFRILAHRAAAFFQLERYQEALEDAIKANQIITSGGIDLRKGETEACLRRQGMALLKLGRLEEALAALESAQQLAILNNSDDADAESAKIQRLRYQPLLEQCQRAAPTEAGPTTATARTKPNPPTGSPIVATAAAPKQINSIKNSAASGMPKYQYYQSDAFMTISILEPNVQLEDLNVNFEEQHLSVVLNKHHAGISTSFTVICGRLYEKVDPNSCKIKIKSEKVLLKLKKNKATFEWPELMSKEINSSTSNSKPASIPPKKKEEEATNTTTAATADDKATPAATTASTTTTTATKASPYASPKDWDSIEKDIAEQEEKEKPPGGDDAMNKLFQQIYGNADEDTKRAMVKSYQTSGGTVLSTNWGEVAKKDYEKERTAPKGMEWKTWEGDKLPQEDD